MNHGFSTQTRGARTLDAAAAGSLRGFWLCLVVGMALVVVPTLLAEDFKPPVKDHPGRIETYARLSDLLNLAYDRNPSIRKAREQWRAIVETYRVAGSYPDPQLTATWYPEPIETRLGPQDWNVQIAQSIPFPGRLSKTGELAAADARIARLKLDKTVKAVLLAVKESYYELGYIRRAKAVTAQNAELLQHISKIAATAHADNRATLMDVIKAQSQTGQLHYDALLLADLEQTERTRLNGLLNRRPEAAVGALEPPPPPSLRLDEVRITRLAEASQEDILMAQLGVEKGDIQVALARLHNRPDFKIGLFYAAIGDPDVPTPPEDAGRDAIGIQAGISIPLWFGRNNSRVASARAEKAAARAEKADRINTLRSRVRNLYFKTRNAQRIIHLYQTDLVPQAARAMEIAELWYREGQSSFTDFIETQAVWHNFQLSLARARADYAINLARLEQLAGTHLSGDGHPAASPPGKEQP